MYQSFGVFAIAFVILFGATRPAQAYTDGYAQADLDGILRTYEQLAAIDPDEPFATALRMQGLRKIAFLHDFIVNGTWKMTDTARRLRLTPAKVVPEFSVPIESQIADLETRIIEDTLRCLEAPNIACMMDTAASGVAADHSSGLGFQGFYFGVLLRLHEQFSLSSTRAVAERLLFNSIDTGNLYLQRKSQSPKSLYTYLLPELYAAGFEANAAIMVEQFLRKYGGRSLDHSPGLLAIYYSKRWRDGKMDMLDLASKVHLAIDASKDQHMKAEGYSTLLMVLHRTGETNSLRSWIETARHDLDEFWHPRIGLALFQLGYPDAAKTFYPDEWFGQGDDELEHLAIRALGSAYMGDEREASDFDNGARKYMQSYLKNTDEPFQWRRVHFSLLWLSEAALALE